MGDAGGRSKIDRALIPRHCAVVALPADAEGHVLGSVGLNGCALVVLIIVGEAISQASAH